MEFSYADFTSRIWEFNENKALGLSVISVYFYLLKIGAERGLTKFVVSDSQLSRDLKMTRKTVKVCKEKLRHYGIISYESRNGVPSDFRLNPDYPVIFTDTDYYTKPDKPNLIDEGKSSLIAIDLQVENQSEKKTSQTTTDLLLVIDPPPIEEFLEYAQSLDRLDDLTIQGVGLKYQDWKNNGWKNNFNRPITNWKSALKSMLPYLKNSRQKNHTGMHAIPVINRIKTTVKEDEL